LIYLISKRIFDSALALLGLFLFLPLGIAIVIFIIFESGLPLFYLKKTIGKDKRTFYAIKFRSMHKGSERVTRVGKILRQTAMDELPQLLNIFKGEMSFVGPRPYGIDKYKAGESAFRERLHVTPGLTGLAQVFLPKGAGDKRVLRYDLRYIKKKSFWFDLYVILMSIWITIKGGWESTTKKL